MLKFVHLALLVVSASSVAAEILSAELLAFNTWTAEHDKLYTTESERLDRFAVWKANDARIQQHNTQIPAPTFTLGHNAYSDMTEAEFAEFFSLKSSNPITKPSIASSVDRRALSEQTVNLPDYVNWIANGAVTPVKNQGSCGSCWAFSTTGALEGAKFLKTGELVSLSEQNLLDCDHVDMGCSGGLMDNAFKFDEKSGGLCSEDDYPYIAQRHKACLTNCTDVPGSLVHTFVDVPVGDETALVSAIAMQPVSVAIEASQFVFQFYKTGVITDDSCGSRGNIDHGVLAVGYGTDLETQAPYFLVKNSWGPTWGEAGYVKIGRGGKNKFGICAILKMASFPVVE